MSNTLLHGHYSPETAYAVDSYPYGRERTECRWWLEKAEKGSQKGKMRVCQQTLNPKNGKWNKPHPSVYADFMVLYLDDNQHCKAFHVNVVSGPRHLVDFVCSGLYFQLNNEELAELEKLIRWVRLLDKFSWDRYDFLVQLARNAQELDAQVLFAEAQKLRPDDHYLYPSQVEEVVAQVRTERSLVH